MSIACDSGSQILQPCRDRHIRGTLFPASSRCPAGRPANEPVQQLLETKATLGPRSP